MQELYSFLATVALFLLLVVSANDGCRARSVHTAQCERSCKGRGEVFERKSGVCTCRDGTTWLWQEGYSRKLGERP